MEKKKKKKFGLLKRFLPYYKKYIWILIADLFCAALTTVCELILPMIVREITGRATDDLATLTLDLILKCGLFYIVLRIIDTGANFYMASFGHIMGTKIETDMRRDLFAQYQRLSFSYYDNTKIGTLMSRITSDLFDVTEFAHHCPEEYFIASIKLIASFIILCSINPWLTLIVFATIPFALLTLIPFKRAMKETFRQNRIKAGEINSQVEDSLLGIRVVKSFVNEDVEQKKFNKGNKEYLSIKKRSYYAMGGFHSCTRLFDGIIYIVVVVAGAVYLLNGGISAADYVAYLLYVTTLIASIRKIVEFTEQFQRGMTGIERFDEIMCLTPEIIDKENAKELKDVSGDIEFKDVSFKYESTSDLVLKNINIKIKAGESIAIVGPSGGGKTTLCSLIPRFYEISDGDITIDGSSISDLTIKSLRENIGTVQQDVYLFSGSIKENIRYGKLNATDEEIEKASRLAGAHEFITNLPDGYDTYVGERGVKLSGGQKQRISIARLFLKNPPILILDEATSSLDNESEYIVQKSLETLAKGRTTLTIAHRLTTIKNADRILVLTESGIEEEGTHEELIAKNGVYTELYKLYSN
ncbi:MAG: ABC transporter ATP-binding protein [Clostridia bacterium]|nr:ABC transporter ATP-binding protein [Clostridia bacterium]